MLFTYFLHLNDESVNVVSGIVVVQVLLVILYLLRNEAFDSVEVVEYFVVRAWQVLHHCRERCIELHRSKHETNNRLFYNF